MGPRRGTRGARLPAGYANAIRERVFIESPVRLRQEQRQGHHRGRHQAPEGHQRRPEGAGDHATRARTTSTLGRGNQSPSSSATSTVDGLLDLSISAAVLRQLLRPARLRRESSMDMIGTNQLDRLPDRPRRCPTNLSAKVVIDWAQRADTRGARLQRPARSSRPSRTRTCARTTCRSGGTGSRSATCRASCRSCARATSTRSTAAARCGWTRSTAGSTTGCRASRTGS